MLRNSVRRVVFESKYNRPHQCKKISILNLEMHIFALITLAIIGTARATGIQDAPDFAVQFDIANPSTGVNSSFSIDVYSSWAELGVAQFKKIIEERAWVGARFFRVVPGQSNSSKDLHGESWASSCPLSSSS